MEPGDGGRLRLPEREREQVRGGPAPAPHLPAHRESSALQSFRDILAQGIAACDEDLVPAQRGGLLVARGGGASQEEGVPEYGVAKLPNEAGPAKPTGNRATLHSAAPQPATHHGITRLPPTQRSIHYAPSSSSR